jgi:mono/diheme cytochrome c family protein
MLARVEWPGKPGAMTPVAPLTREEQQRYDAGKEIYKNLCQACHQPDGRGQEKIARSLIDSPFVLGPSEIAVRILINGKEGSTGLMPPLGSVLSDGKVAEVVTYIRREWGQTASPIDAAAVAAVRQSVSGRVRPWTDDELTALLRADHPVRQP